MLGRDDRGELVRALDQEVAQAEKNTSARLMRLVARHAGRAALATAIASSTSAVVANALRLHASGGRVEHVARALGGAAGFAVDVVVDDGHADPPGSSVVRTDRRERRRVSLPILRHEKGLARMADRREERSTGQIVRMPAATCRRPRSADARGGSGLARARRGSPEVLVGGAALSEPVRLGARLRQPRSRKTAGGRGTAADDRVRVARGTRRPGARSCASSCARGWSGS